MTCAYRLVDGKRYFVVCDGGKIYNKRQWSPEDEMIKPYYEHAGITIYHGDCREILPELPKVDLVLTDPPYGISRIMVGGAGWAKQYDGEYREWDDTAPDLGEWFWESSDVFIIWGGNYFNLPPSRGWLIHDKVVRGMTWADCEMAWTNQDMNSRIYSYMPPNGFMKDKRWHPTEKPLPLMSWCLSMFPDAQTILDPFMGSGTTLVAAKNLNRKAIGIEIEEKYCEIAVKRLAQENLFTEIA